MDVGVLVTTVACIVCNPSGSEYALPIAPPTPPRLYTVQVYAFYKLGQREMYIDILYLVNCLRTGEPAMSDPPKIGFANSSKKLPCMGVPVPLTWSD